MARKSNRQGVAMLRERGHRAYLEGDYDTAIEMWQRVGEQIKKMQPHRIFAEAYFRRGVERIHQDHAIEAGVKDLRQALKLYPKTPRYTYHLGMGLHLQGEYTEAITIYEQVRKAAPEFAARAAYPLALAIMQRGDDPAAHPVWAELTAEEQVMLRDVQTFRRRPYELAEAAPPLWHGIVALDQEDWGAAEDWFNAALDTAEFPDTKALTHYYLGNTAAQREDMDAARHHWSEASALGMTSSWLTLNVGESFYRLAETRLETEDVSGALDAARMAEKFEVDTPSFTELLAQIDYHRGYQAANRGDWEQATEHWQKAYDLEEGSFRAAYNLALAYERHEQYIPAAEMWREVLRRRPRKDDHRDAISDEEVAQLWKRAAQAYIKAGEYDEAVHVYRMAVKWNPDNLETRMELVQSMFDNGRLQAAENELDRILERSPDYVPALVRMGEVHSARNTWWEPSTAISYWKRALALEPNNVAAQSALLDYYLNQAEDALRWGRIDRAYTLLQEALEHQPKNVDALNLLARCYVLWDDLDEVQVCIDDILDRSQPTLNNYLTCADIWVMAHCIDKAAQVIDQAEKMFKHIPVDTYVEIGFRIFDFEKYIEDEHIEMARTWFERAVEKSTPADKIRLKVGERLAMETRLFDLAVEYLERAIEADEEPGAAYLSLAMLKVRQGDLRQGRRYLRKAESLARRDKNHELIHMTMVLRDMMDVSPGYLDAMLSSPFSFDLDGPSFFDDF